MSAKYKRIKQADAALPAPLRWLTRAFSSITLAVILLCLVALYGVLGSVPVKFLAVLGPAKFDGPALIDVSLEEPWRSLKTPVVYDP